MLFVLPFRHSVYLSVRLCVCLSVYAGLTGPSVGLLCVCVSGLFIQVSPLLQSQLHSSISQLHH